jgi:hypothetical protein
LLSKLRVTIPTTFFILSAISSKVVASGGIYTASWCDPPPPKLGERTLGTQSGRSLWRCWGTLSSWNSTSSGHFFSNIGMRNSSMSRDTAEHSTLAKDRKPENILFGQSMKHFPFLSVPSMFSNFMTIVAHSNSQVMLI